MFAKQVAVASQGHPTQDTSQLVVGGGEEYIRIEIFRPRRVRFWDIFSLTLNSNKNMNSI